MMNSKGEVLRGLSELSESTTTSVAELLLNEQKRLVKAISEDLSHVVNRIKSLYEHVTGAKILDTKYECLELNSIISILPRLITTVICKHDFNDVNTKLSVIHEVELLYKGLQRYKTQYFPDIKTAVEADPWNMAEVRKEQVTYSHETPHTLEKNHPARKFYKLLKMIKRIARIQKHPAHQIFFCNAWPNKKFPEESWVPNFLKTLSDHLQCAGFLTILDQDGSLMGGNPQWFMEKLNTSRYVFYFGTRTMKGKVLTDPNAMVLKEIEMIKSRRHTDPKDNTVIPHLLSGDFSDAIHTELLNLYAIYNIGSYGYLGYLQAVIRRVYVGTDCWNDYDKLWSLFNSKSWQQFDQFCTELKGLIQQGQATHLSTSSPKAKTSEFFKAPVQTQTTPAPSVSVNQSASKPCDQKTMFKSTFFVNHEGATLTMGTVKGTHPKPPIDRTDGIDVEQKVFENRGSMSVVNFEFNSN